MDESGLELRGKTYWLNFTFNKKRIHESTRTTHKVEALKVLTKRKLELMEEEEQSMFGSSRKGNDITFKEATALAYEDHYKHLAGEGPKIAEQQMEILCEFIGDMRVSAIDESTFAMLGREIPKRSMKLYSRVCTPATVNHYYHVVNGCLRAARKIVRAPCMPFSKIKLKVQKQVIRPVSGTDEEEILKLFNDAEFIKGNRNKWTNRDLIEIYSLGITTGMRRGELFSFTVDQLDGRIITLRPDQHKTGKHTGEKKIVLPPESMDLLKARVERLKLKPTDRMFSYSKNAYTRLWNRAKVKAGITGRLTPHSMRHAFATRKISKGMSIYHVSKLLGHTSVTTTEMYAKVDQTELLNAMEKYA